MRFPADGSAPRHRDCDCRLAVPKHGIQMSCSAQLAQWCDAPASWTARKLRSAGKLDSLRLLQPLGDLPELLVGDVVVVPALLLRVLRCLDWCWADWCWADWCWVDPCCCAACGAGPLALWPVTAAAGARLDVHPDRGVLERGFGTIAACWSFDAIWRDKAELLRGAHWEPNKLSFKEQLVRWGWPLIYEAGVLHSDAHCWPQVVPHHCGNSFHFLGRVKGNRTLPK